MKVRYLPVLAVAAAGALVLTACSPSSSPGTGQPAAAVTDGTLNWALSTDPGNLFPQGSTFADSRQLMAFGYDSLITVDDNGTPKPWLAEKWTASSTEVTFTLKDGVTCSDGSPLTAQTVADNFTWITDTKNSSPVSGTFVPVGMTAKADNSARTVTVTSPTPNSFFLELLGQVFIACGKAIASPDKYSSAFDGTGLYTLSAVKPGESYTLTRRDDYTWGPDGTTSKTAGLPKTVTVSVVSDDTTRANLLLAGSINTGTVVGPDAARLDAQGIPGLPLKSGSTELFFNQAASRPASDPAVRKALVQSTNTKAMADIMAGGKGEPFQSLLSGKPTTCAIEDVHKSAPAFDTAAAAKTLDDAGWKVGAGGVRSKDGQGLSIKLLYRNSTEKATAFEFLADEWKKLGVDVTLRGGDTAVLNDLKSSGTGDWDVIDWYVGAPFPTTLVPFFSGSTSSNFSKINNSTYNEHVALASNKLGTQGCPDWQIAERALVSNADILGIGWIKNTTYTRGFTANRSLQIDPWSIRQSG
ncbi:ABC transporter substrate-binding protein [Arthrobacter sp. 18067]|uniref:ABC transporter substrate-binding protein n=1 Tax=Arthrobacter sp. 18067 TaxID=2681413 RepID=UPI00135CED6F|nr:ABC transporter substrate-binding protein [Arthrobacter sp. 18067]